MNAVTVTELSNYIKSLLDNNENLNAYWFAANFRTIKSIPRDTIIFRSKTTVRLFPPLCSKVMLQRSGLSLITD